MSAFFRWETDRRNPQLQCCFSEAQSWTEIRPALISSWVRFGEVLATRVSSELQNEIHLSFLSSSGRVTFDHARSKSASVGLRWDSIPLDYIWTVMCKCNWIEQQWYAVSDADDEQAERLLGNLGTTFARHCLQALSDPEVAVAFQRQRLANVRVLGQGVTQSPKRFEMDLQELMQGKLPDLHP